jgi:hypothetical protein
VRQSESVKKNLPQQCDRQLFEKLKAVKARNGRKKTKHYLTNEEVNRSHSLSRKKGGKRIPY